MCRLCVCVCVLLLYHSVMSDSLWPHELYSPWNSLGQNTGVKCVNFVAAVTVLSDFGAQENKVCHCFRFFPIWCHEVMRLDVMILVFECWVLSQPFTTLAPLSRGSFSSSFFFGVRMMPSTYLRLFIFLPEIWFQLVLHPAWHFSWCTLHIS